MSISETSNSLIARRADQIGQLDHVDLVIFDCDGVLIDSEPIASRTLATALGEAGVAMTPIEAHVKFTGNSESTIREMCARDLGIADATALFEAWHRILFSEFKSRLTAMPGIENIVRRIDRPKCVASNSTMRRLGLSLGLLDLWDSFAPHVFSAEAVGRPKPAPDLLFHCAEKLGARPDHCIMIDDSPHGVAAARAAGMVALGFVDPADPRPDRKELLAASGAFAVATGASELVNVLEAAGRSFGG